MSFSSSRKTHTHETFIRQEQFESYAKSSYVIFMAAPTAFGTSKAIKITVIDNLSPN